MAVEVEGILYSATDEAPAFSWVFDEATDELIGVETATKERFKLGNAIDRGWVVASRPADANREEDLGAFLSDADLERCGCRRTRLRRPWHHQDFCCLYVPKPEDAQKEQEQTEAEETAEREEVFRQHREAFTEAMRGASGRVQSDQPLVAFLYLLARDHLPVGTINEIVRENSMRDLSIFTDGWLAQWAQYLALYLVPVSLTLEPTDTPSRGDK